MNKIITIDDITSVLKVWHNFDKTRFGGVWTLTLTNTYWIVYDDNEHRSDATIMACLTYPKGGGEDILLGPATYETLAKVLFAIAQWELKKAPVIESIEVLV